MKRRTLLLPLILIAMFLFCGSAYATEAQTTTDVNMTETSTNKFYYDGRSTESSSVIFHKFTVRKPALVRITGKTYYSTGEFYANKVYGSFWVCDQNKKTLFAINDYYIHDTDTPYACFFLNAGTYYLKGEINSPYTLNLNCKNYSRKTAKAKKKAVNLKKDKKVDGYFLKGEKDVHWYKLTLPKKQKVKFTFESYGSGYTYFYIYGKKKNDVTYAYCYDKKATGIYQTILKGKVAKGTYYIKVMRQDKNISGQYSIRWK